MGKRKRIVSTKAMGAQKKIDKILIVLRRHPDGVYPKSIALESGINVNTVKTVLNKLEEEKHVERIVRGLYRFVEKKTHGLKDYNFQNVVISFESDKILIESRVEEEHDLGVVKLRYSIGKKSKQATLQVCTDSPFHLSAFPFIGKIFQDFIFSHCRLRPTFSELVVSTFEINKDHHTLLLSGAEMVTIGTIIAELKVYNKPNGLREEYKTKIPISFDILLRMINEGAVSAENMALSSNNQERIQILERNFAKLRLMFKDLMKLVASQREKVGQ